MAHTNWQLIETGPHDTSLVLLWDGSAVQVGFYGASINHEVWRNVNWQMLNPQPTHWMPMPDPPAEAR